LICALCIVIIFWRKDIKNCFSTGKKALKQEVIEETVSKISLLKGQYSFSSSNII